MGKHLTRFMDGLLLVIGVAGALLGFFAILAGCAAAIAWSPWTLLVIGVVVISYLIGWSTE